jgi:hypothetical protein
MDREWNDRQPIYRQLRDRRHQPNLRRFIAFMAPKSGLAND